EGRCRGEGERVDPCPDRARGVRQRGEPVRALVGVDGRPLAAREDDAGDGRVDVPMRTVPLEEGADRGVTLGDPRALVEEATGLEERTGVELLDADTDRVEVPDGSTVRARVGRVAQALHAFGVEYADGGAVGIGETCREDAAR